MVWIINVFCVFFLHALDLHKFSYFFNKRKLHGAVYIAIDVWKGKTLKAVLGSMYGRVFNQLYCLYTYLFRWTTLYAKLLGDVLTKSIWAYSRSNRPIFQKTLILEKNGQTQPQNRVFRIRRNETSEIRKIKWTS